jgi:hypothetical protein
MTLSRRPPRPTFAVVSAALLALAAIPGAAVASEPMIDLGDPSVLSQRGQRLSIALPYGSAPGERVSVSRFEVVSVEAPDGWAAPDPSGFSFAKPARRNLVYLRSRETVDAPELALTVRVAEQPQSLQTFTVQLPAARASASQAAEPSAVPVSARAAAGKRPARRTPAPERRAAR